MSETKLATKADLKEMYDRMLPYMGGMPEMLANKFSKGDLYSTDEKMIGQWIDGKPLYQKTVIAAISGGTTEGQLYYKQIDVSSLSIDSFISCNACLKGSNICITLPSFEYVASFGRCYFIFAGSSTTLQININEANATVLNRIKESSAYVTLQYTKTTDSAISIGSDTDYSTDEKIVGTWIDGKPIWQKTFAYTNLEISIADSWIELENISSLNIDIENGFFKSEGTFHIVNTALYAPITTTNRNGTDIYTKGVTVRLSNHSDYGHDSLQIISTQIQTFVSAYITIQYTKTTS